MEKVAVVGIEINANHLKSVRSGWVYGKATPVKIGKRIQVWNINITNEDKEDVCISRLTLAVVKSAKYNNSFTKE
jgi:1,4-dihydroxy-2-naphthoyl-CoA hydrolase